MVVGSEGVGGVVISSRREFIPAGPRGQIARYAVPPCDLAPRAGSPRARREEITTPPYPDLRSGAGFG
jgi:hypothetical protein